MTYEESDVVRTSDFKIGEKYKIKRFEMFKTKYGNKVVAILEKGPYFLPPRYARIILEMTKNPETIECIGAFVSLVGRRQDNYASPILSFEGAMLVEVEM